ncbi:hypothetical protein [Staphylococcus aureus]|uniref:hypothetical protein n=1 Tax=Staphylococcus aureus TaxID=1280 RepID=UPI001642AC44|nr:hypothetical protein [Staphylococcus aureus]
MGEMVFVGLVGLVVGVELVVVVWVGLVFRGEWVVGEWVVLGGLYVVEWFVDVDFGGLVLEVYVVQSEE